MTFSKWWSPRDPVFKPCFEDALSLAIDFSHEMVFRVTDELESMGYTVWRGEKYFTITKPETPGRRVRFGVMEPETPQPTYFLGVVEGSKKEEVFFVTGWKNSPKLLLSKIQKGLGDKNGLA